MGGRCRSRSLSWPNLEQREQRYPPESALFFSWQCKFCVEGPWSTSSRDRRRRSVAHPIQIFQISAPQKRGNCRLGSRRWAPEDALDASRGPGPHHRDRLRGIRRSPPPLPQAHCHRTARSWPRWAPPSGGVPAPAQIGGDGGAGGGGAGAVGSVKYRGLLEIAPSNANVRGPVAAQVLPVPVPARPQPCPLRRVEGFVIPKAWP